MDEKDKQKSTVFDRLNPMADEHFKPLSRNSLITCEQKDGLHLRGTLPHPFVNFKIEVMNSCRKKRKADDTAATSEYETPAKKVFSPNALSPDLGCVMDYSTLTTRHDSFSPSASSKLSLLENSHTLSGEITGNVCFQQQSQRVKFGLSGDNSNIKENLPHSLKNDEVLSDLSPDFDCDIDYILCLNPAPSSTAEFSEKVERTHRQKVEKRQENENQEWNKESGKDEEDKGYFSASYVKDCESGKTLSPSGYSQLLFVTPSPQSGVVKAPGNESQAESSTGQDCLKQVKLSAQEVSFTEKGFCPIVSGSQLGSVNCPEELLEGDVEEVWSIGQPIFESSMCQKISVMLDGDGEQEKLEGNVTEAVHEVHEAALSYEETSYETSYDTTLPLVKVKSVVVAPSHSDFHKKLKACFELNAASSEPSQNRNRGFQPARPVSFKTNADLEREKRMYVHSVTAHMNERPPASSVTELRNLMTHVADQSTGPCAGQWQHPSDLTQRNFKKSFGNVKANMPLVEWQAKNCSTHKRFSKIPQIFKRSPFH